jgi:hypothetical protein
MTRQLGNDLDPRDGRGLKRSERWHRPDMLQGVEYVTVLPHDGSHVLSGKAHGAAMRQ